MLTTADDPGQFSGRLEGLRIDIVQEALQAGHGHGTLSRLSSTVGFSPTFPGFLAAREASSRLICTRLAVLLTSPKAARRGGFLVVAALLFCWNMADRAGVDLLR